MMLLLLCSRPTRDAVEAVTSLYNQLEEKLHTLVMRSNESLQHLQHLSRLREVEGHINTVLVGLMHSSTFFPTLLQVFYGAV